MFYNTSWHWNVKWIRKKVSFKAKSCYPKDDFLLLKVFKSEFKKPKAKKVLVTICWPPPPPPRVSGIIWMAPKIYLKFLRRKCLIDISLLISLRLTNKISFCRSTTFENEVRSCRVVWRKYLIFYVRSREQGFSTFFQSAEHYWLFPEHKHTNQPSIKLATSEAWDQPHFFVITGVRYNRGSL